MNDLLAVVLAVANEILAAGIVIVAASLLLYNITRNRNNRVARSSGIVLACVTFAYIVDVFLSLGPAQDVAELSGRLQWLGIAFIPAALFHLSDALLATTGLPSRGRRRTVVRLLYLLSALFALGVAFSDQVAIPQYGSTGLRMQPALFFYVYTAYFVTALLVTYINVRRARNRALTSGSQRRLDYLQFAILTPALGIYPYSAFLPVSGQLTLPYQLLVNLANIVVIIMLVFISYPLSFFGSSVPDRVVRIELLRFLLRGPGTGILALITIIGTSRATDILSLTGTQFTPFAVVAVVMLWQWVVDVTLPTLEKWLIYRDEEDEQLQKLQDLSDQILTHGDLNQLLHGTLEAICNYLRTADAFLVSVVGDAAQSVAFVGDVPEETQKSYKQHNGTEPHDSALEAWIRVGQEADRVGGRSAFEAWNEFFIVPLYSRRISSDQNDKTAMIGLLGVRVNENPLNLVDAEDADLLYALVQRAERTLDDLLLQNELFAALEGLMPQLSITRRRATEVEYRPSPGQPRQTSLPAMDEAYEQVRAALKHYWGGPGISRSRLLDFHIVEERMATEESGVQALRSVLQEAIDQLRPEGERSMTAPEWTLYNILDMRFLEGKRVRDVAQRMSMSEADLYRKQRLAIETVARSILDQEKASLQQS